MERKFELKVNCPEGARIRVFAVANAGSKENETETEIFAVSCENGETRFELIPDRYVIRQEKKGFYTAERCLDLAEDTTLSLPLEERFHYGYEPSEEQVNFSYEGWDKFAPDEDERWAPYEVIFDTPAFQKRQGAGKHRIYTNEEMWEFVRKEEEKNPNMKVYTLFESRVYNLPAPIAVFSKDLPQGDLTLEELGAALRKTGKPVVHYQAQIHGNETSGGNAALGLIKYLATPEGERLLDQIHLYIIPRANPEGALLYRRTGGKGLDLNRDFLSLYSVENQGAFRAFRAFEPCLVIDAHELRSRKLSRIMRYEDIQLSSGVAPNADPEFYDNNLNLLFEATAEMQKLGLRNYFYLDHVSGVEMTTSTRFFVERGAMTVLIECRGINLGNACSRRRVMGQFTAARKMLEAFAADPEKYAAPCRRERAGYLDPFDREFVVEGAYTDDPEHDPKFPITYFDVQTGELVKTEDKPLTIYRKIVRTRPRPSAYVLPLGKGWEEELIALLDRQFIKYEKKEGCQTRELTQFIRKGDTVTLSDAKACTFEKGVLVVPVAQEASRIVSFIFEADCPDSVKAKELLNLEKHLQELFFPEGDAYDIYREEK
ncbi:MAG: hypothetical protein IJC26_02340 [Clostridia bacterium]|nr:hypothetical protein [Clostridia bacterium]